MRMVMSVFGATCLVAALCGAHAWAQAAKPKPLQVKDLPARVQKTVQETLKGGTVKNIAKEKEHGIEQYEIEFGLTSYRRKA